MFKCTSKKFGKDFDRNLVKPFAKQDKNVRNIIYNFKYIY